MSTGWARIEYGIIDRLPELGKSAMIVYLILARHADADGRCWPGLTRLSALGNMRRHTVIAGIDALEKAGLVGVDRTAGRPNTYTMTSAKPDTAPRLSSDNRDTGTSDNRDTGTSDNWDTRTRTIEQEPLNKNGRSQKSEPKPDQLPSDLLVEKWNAIPGIRRCQKMTAARLRAFKARRKEAGWVDQVDAALERVAASPFLTGENDRGWKADIDFFLRPDSMTKIIEGKYDGRSNGQPPNSSFRVPPGKPYVFKASDSP